MSRKDFILSVVSKATVSTIELSNQG